MRCAQEKAVALPLACVMSPRPWPCLALAWHCVALRRLGKDEHYFRRIGLDMPCQRCVRAAMPSLASVWLGVALPVLGLALLAHSCLNNEPTREHQSLHFRRH